jgi:hypothetical protein
LTVARRHRLLSEQFRQNLAGWASEGNLAFVQCDEIITRRQQD